jgi:PAS domain S-box-containing protein
MIDATAVNAVQAAQPQVLAAWRALVPVDVVSDATLEALLVAFVARLRGDALPETDTSALVGLRPLDAARVLLTLRDPLLEALPGAAREVHRALDAWALEVAEQLPTAESPIAMLGWQDLLLHYHPDAIFAIDLEGCVTAVSPAVLSLTGYAPEEVMGKPFAPLVYPDDLPLAMERLALVMRGQPQNYDVRIVHRQGHSVLVNATSIPIMRGGRVAGIYGVAQDISERKRVEERLARAALYVDLLRAVAVIANDADTLDEALQTTLETICGQLGWPLAHVWLRRAGGRDLRSAAIWCLATPDAFATFRAASADPGFAGDVLASGQAVWLRDLRETPHVARAEAARAAGIVAGFAFPVKVSGEVVAVLEFFHTQPVERDDEILAVMEQVGAQLGRVVERERARAEMTAVNERLAWSNRELQDFASVASHDLQEPLRKVRAFGDRLNARYGEQLGEDGRDYLARMLNASQRMQILINDLLAYSRVTTRAQPFVPLDLTQIVFEVVSDLESQIEQTAGRIEIGALPQLQADPLQMRQVFQNLLSNALKFHRQGEPPLVRVSATLLPAARPGKERVAIRVCDNGIGFEPQYAERIFRIFERLHGRDAYEGTGIGLAICRKIVERHGGSIAAEGTPDAGSCFTLTLPLTQPESGQFTI